jgi:RNA 2',3'-cyclic 3'-phosphodiesterase
VERARLFVALDLPEAIRERLAAWSADRLGAMSGLRLIDRHALHVTLCFLGWRDAAEVGEIAAACRAAAPPDAFPLSLGEALCLPPRRPRVIAVELPDPSGGLARLQAALSAALAQGGFYKPESRPYLGHVTVGRVGRGAGGKVSAQPLPSPEPVGFDAETVTLYRSRLERGGARYEALETVVLG